MPGVIAKRLLVDTNVLVRFFTGEPAAMALAAKALVEKAERGDVILEIPPLIVAETLYTLESFYKRDRVEVVDAFLPFLESKGVKTWEKGRVIDALVRHRNTNVHFADAYLAATAAELRIAVSSFDRDFDKFKDIRREDPKT